MAHSSLTGSNLHENKGVAAATDNTVATASSGATSWQKLTASHLTGTGNPFGGQLFHVRDQRAAGSAGTAYTAGGFRTITLQTSVTNEISSASLASSQLTLPSGTYYIDAQAYTGETVVGANKTRIRNITDGTTTIVGMSATDGSPLGNTTSALHTIKGRFTLSGTKVLEFQIYPQSNTAATLASNVGEVEVYADIMLWKVG